MGFIALDGAGVSMLLRGQQVWNTMSVERPSESILLQQDRT